MKKTHRPSFQPALSLHATAWACISLCTSLSCAAQSAPTASPSPTELDPVVVSATTSATRLADAPFAASVVDSKTLRQAGAMINLSEALTQVPGLAISNRQNYAQDLQISSRGFGARATFGVRGLRLYTDGIPATMPDGQGQVSHFDLASAERIEVIRGPFSALYGNASGGVISLISQPITEPYFESGLDLGSHALYQARVSGGAPISPVLAMSASASVMHTDGFRPQSAADKQQGNAKAVWTYEQDRIVAQYSQLKQDAQDPLGLTRAQFASNPNQTTSEATTYNTRKSVDQAQLGVSWQRRYTQQGPLAESQVSAYNGRRSVTQFLGISAATQGTNALTTRHSGGVVDFDREYGGLDGRLTWRWTGLELVTGLNAEDQYDDRRGYLNYTGSSSNPSYGNVGSLRRDENNSARTREAYSQAEWAFAPNWAASAGLRAGEVTLTNKDHYVVGINGDDSGNMRFHYTTPVAGVRWKVDPTLTLHAGVGKGFESPTLSEVAYRADATSAGFNTDLKAQTSRHAEMGAKWRPSSNASLDATVFNVKTANEIAVLTNAGGRSSYQNVGDTTRYGAELAAAWRPSTTWRTKAALTWLEAHYDDSFTTCVGTPCTRTVANAGNRIAGTQRLNAWTELAWLPTRGLEAGVEWQGRSRTPVNDVNSDFAQGWGIVNLRVRQRWNLDQRGTAIELLGRVDNVGDKRYAGSVIVNDANNRFFEPAMGRSALVSLRYIQGF